MGEQLELFDITVDEYQHMVAQTAIFSKEIGLTYCTLGLTGEAGEVAEKVKKLFRDKEGVVTPEFVHDVTRELGDVLWYITALGSTLGISLQDVMKENHRKLNKRLATNTIHGDGDNREE